MRVFPSCTRGGHIIEHIEPSDNGGRKFGSLQRQIIGDCTVKDQMSSYWKQIFERGMGVLPVRATVGTFELVSLKVTPPTIFRRPPQVLRM